MAFSMEKGQLDNSNPFMPYSHETAYLDGLDITKDKDIEAVFFMRGNPGVDP